MNPVGERIRTLRNEKNMSLPELAGSSGLSKGLLSKLENTDEPNPSLETLHKVAKALDATLSDLLETEKIRAKKRFLPDVKPEWVPSLRKDLGKEPDPEILEALYLVQHRKAATIKKDVDWLYMYRSLEMSLGTGSK